MAEARLPGTRAGLGLALACFAGALGCVAGHGGRTGNFPFVGRGLLLSNSPAWIEDVRPELAAGALRLEYSVLADNVGPVTYAVLAAQSTFDARGERAGVQCREHGKAPAGVVLLPPNTKLRVDCLIRYSPEQTRKLAGSDAEGTFTLWLKALGPEPSPEPVAWPLPYALFADDFQ